MLEQSLPTRIPKLWACITVKMPISSLDQPWLLWFSLHSLLTLWRQQRHLYFILFYSNFTTFWSDAVYRALKKSSHNQLMIFWKRVLLFHCCKTYHAGRSHVHCSMVRKQTFKLFYEIWSNTGNCFTQTLLYNIIFNYVLFSQKEPMMFCHTWHSTSRSCFNTF